MIRVIETKGHGGGGGGRGGWWAPRVAVKKKPLELARFQPFCETWGWVSVVFPRASSFTMFTKDLLIKNPAYSPENWSIRLYCRLRIFC